ncbi:ATP-grasp fold amidoligase family protein [Enterococcus faecium]|uniref:ATP-grasp fold amidoligase family protein n=1 Tax=Enterococcus faecium TaxID=1352 RepID=UPI002954FFFD|nr:ATP-grasp fold amidoligase family protein [Enterococcus faecium]MDV7750952.1 ATP-grasp fold amidoligase family protein [Enterococcus faecium]
MRSFQEIISILNARGFLRFISDEAWLKDRYKQVFGVPLNLDSPKSFNEKLQWMKLFYRNSKATNMVDKITAKEYVRERLGDEIGIIPTFGVWDSFDDIEWGTLPNQFVLKCNHDSGGLVICRDKEKFDKSAAKKKINKCLKKNYFWHGREWVYKNIKPRILAEKYMENIGETEISDYKFYCFNGEPKFLYVSTGLENHKTARMGFFDLDFNMLPVRRTDYLAFDEPPKKPTQLKEMLVMAQKLSEGFPFLRVDLYEIDGRVYFSELTFIPCSGWMTVWI